MKFSTLITAAAVLFSLFAKAQSDVNNAYAITSEKKGAYEWTEVKLIDLSNGNVVRNIFESNKGQFNVFDARSMKEIKLKKINGVVSDNDNMPFSGFSAACAYDKKLNRLYYAPMFINQLRYIDLNAATPKVFIFQQEPFSAADNFDAESNQVTRMAIASDGNGYALNNDGAHLVKFTTDQKPVFTDLGPLLNAPENGEMSISDANTSWGGDMIADASGNLYLISSHNHLFKINVQSRKATYIAKIKDLPEGFTTNGAAVNQQGQIVLTSANFVTAYYAVDVKTWKATIIANNEHVFNTSDLANENLLFKTALVSPVSAISVNEKISVYPNPVRTSSFRVTFMNKESGRYNIQLVDIAGRITSDKVVSISGPGQVSEIKMDPGFAKGMYMVKVLSNNKKEIFVKKIVVE
ncbi:MAG: T9SS type A sorting domain-containing protein [Flavitalea sp.]